MHMPDSGENGVTQLPRLFSWGQQLCTVLCLQLPSTARFCTLRDQAPGSTSLLRFVSDVVVFPGPFLLKA